MPLDPLVASVGSLFDRAIVDTGRLPEFLFFISFLISWGFIRTSAHMIRAQVSWWPGNVEVGGTHIHHLVWGIILLLVCGWVAVTFEPEPPIESVIAVVFGVGAGLTLDEFALWLNLRDVYWEKEGRRSIDAVVVAASVAGIALIGFSAWLDVAKRVEEGLIAFVSFFGGFAIAAAFVNVAKEKFGMALWSLVIPLVGLVGAVRYGRPRSLWARVAYRSDHRRAKAAERFAGRESPWFWKNRASRPRAWGRRRPGGARPSPPSGERAP